MFYSLMTIFVHFLVNNPLTLLVECDGIVSIGIPFQNAIIGNIVSTNSLELLAKH